MDFISQILDQFLKPKDKGNHKFAMVYSHKYNLPLGNHVFPAIKYEQLYNLFSLDEELGKVEIFHPEPVNRNTLELVHTKNYLNDLLTLSITDSTKLSELPLNQSILDAFLYGVGGTLLSVELTERYEFVFNIGGGYHHSYPDHAEGFCYLNDVGVAAIDFLRKNPEKKILIIDLDVHQGNGNSVIFQNEDRVYTFSMHQENLYPRKEKSDFDVGLADGCGDGEYLSVLNESLEKISESFLPDLIFYLAGADPFEDDRLGSLKITKNGLISRDRMVKEFALKYRSKVVILTAGGYSYDTNDTVQIHCNTAREFLKK